MRGTVAVEDANIEDNKAKFLGGGIFIESNATTVLSGGEITGNEAPGENGGGIFSFGSLTATGAIIKDNSSMEGGGLGLDAPATLTDDTVTGNLAEGLGGGIYTDDSLTLTNSSVAENRLTRPEGAGGGIAFEGARESVLNIEGSTIGPSNFAADGDGVFLFGESAIAKLTRSTIAENGAINSELGGGVYVRDGVETILHDVTLAENSAGIHGSEGGNVYAEAGSKLSWENSLVADDLSGGNCLVNGSTLTSLGGNEEYATGTECHFTNARDTKGPELESAQLLPLAHNGGLTETMALTKGSPPVDTGFGCEATDQRGVPRPQGPACDAGAYELVTTPLVVTIISGPSGPVNTPVVSFSFSAEKPSTFQCGLDGGVFEPCTSPFTAGSLALGAHTFTVQATDTADNMGPVSASRTFTIVAPGAGSNAGSSANNGSSDANLSANNGSSNASSSATKGPVVSGLAQSAARWREGAPLPHISRARAGPPLGTTFSFNLNEQAAVRFSFTQRLNGRELGHRCLGRSKKNFKRKSCLRTVTVGTISFTGHLGTNKVFFQGRLSRSKKLQPGRYMVTVNATDAAGGRSTPVSLRFTVVNG